MDETEVINAAEQWLRIVRLYEQTDIYEREELDLAMAGMTMAKTRYKRLLSAHVQKQIDMTEAQKRLEDSIAELLHKGETE
jgi:multidrug resistance efflux pump